MEREGWRGTSGMAMPTTSDGVNLGGGLARVTTPPWRIYLPCGLEYKGYPHFPMRCLWGMGLSYLLYSIIPIVVFYDWVLTRGTDRPYRIGNRRAPPWRATTSGARIVLRQANSHAFRRLSSP